MARFQEMQAWRACTRWTSRPSGNRTFSRSSNFCQLVQIFQSVYWVPRDSLTLICSWEVLVFPCFVATCCHNIVHSLDFCGVSKLRNQQNMIVVDLRGEDRTSGHIRGTVHVPAMDLLKQIQTYVEEFRHQPIVAFFCQYSAHRAPTVAGCILTYCNNMLAVHVRFLISRVITKPFQKRQFQQGETKATRSPTSTARAAPPSSV